MSPMTTAERHVSVPEAAELLGMDGGELYLMIFRGGIRATPTLEQGVLVPLDEVERLARERRADDGR